MAEQRVFRLKQVISWSLNSSGICESVVLSFGEVTIALTGAEAAKFTIQDKADNLQRLHHINWLMLDGRVGVLDGFSFSL